MFVKENPDRKNAFLSGTSKASYIGKTYIHMELRVSGHQGVSIRTGKPVKGTLSISVRGRMVICNYQVAWGDFGILGSEFNKFILELK